MEKPPIIKRPWLGLLSIGATAFAIFAGRLGEPCLGSLFIWLSGAALGFVLALIALIMRERPRSFAVSALVSNVIAVVLSFCL